MPTAPQESNLMNSLHGVSDSCSRSFVDPEEYQAAIRGGDSLLSFLGRGTFRGEVTTIEVGQVMLQRGCETLPRLSSSRMPTNKVGILGWPGDGALPVVRGVQMRRGQWMSLGLGMQSHHRTFGPVDFVSLTVDASDLTRAAIELTGQELTVTAGKILQPPDDVGAQLSSVIEAAIRVSRTTPGMLMAPRASIALEQALLRLMIMCLLQGETRKESLLRYRRAAIAKRFAEEVEANFDCPLLIPDVCRTIGVPERTLRKLCQEQLGMSPRRFLALRRLHLARRALLRSDHHAVTVSEIITGHGVWELGRFAVTYKSLFGESPSSTLRRRLVA
jgi:AraC-like DNA-binding protein